MRLIGMLDSPYVRRTAITLEFLGVPFTHEAVSVFTTFEQFQRINPVVKAPTLVCDDGSVLMDSSLIIQFVEAAAANGNTLWSRDPLLLQREIRAVGLALAACDKAVQMIHERNLRPQAAQYEPWLERVRGQLLAACGELENELTQQAQVFVLTHSQAAITTAVAWRFIQSMLATVVPASAHPALSALSVKMEQQPAFLKYPPAGPGVVATGR
jgi:glutathione S-transferase